MRNKPFLIQFWLDKSEKNMLETRARKAGFTNSAYLRTLIAGHIPRGVPPTDFLTLYRELNAIGNSLNQLAAKANAIGFINATDYTQLAKEVQDMTLKIYQAVMQPERIE